MSRFVIFSDSSCDLPEDLRIKYDLKVIPFYVSFNKENYLRENIDINVNEFYTKILNDKVIPKTSLPSIDDYINYFKPVLDAEKDILCFTLSSEFSGSYQSAVNAAEYLLEQYPNRQIKVLDSKKATAGQGLFVLEALKMQTAGHSLEETYSKMLEIRDDSLIIFTIDTLEYLQKGGRIGRAAALAGNLLNIKPILLLKNGVLEPHSKTRGRKKAMAEILNIFNESLNKNLLDKYEIAIANAHCLEDAIELENMLKEKFDISLSYPIFDIGVTVGAHTGPSALGIGFIKKYNS